MKPLFLLSFATLLQAQQKQIEFIDFFGYEGIDTATIRKALPIHEGASFSVTDTGRNQLKQTIKQSIFQITGKQATDVRLVCCTRNGNAMIFIGLQGSSSASVPYNKAPTGSRKLPHDLVKLDGEIDRVLFDAIAKGTVTEDNSAGYSLANDPAAREKQLAFRELALKYEQEILDVAATSSDDTQRAIAATGLGYIRQTDTQLKALIQSSTDPSSLVRNNAVRALGVLLGARPTLKNKVSPGPFLDLVRSGDWTDRNKGTMVLLELTKDRDPLLLSDIRKKALQPLIEVARWQSPGHAYAARLILGRVAGVDEKQINQLIESGKAEEIIQQALSPRKSANPCVYPI